MKLKFVVAGLTMSSSWGNGHATLWRGLCRALAELGHQVSFYERDVPFYAAHRDLAAPDYCRLVLYRDWDEVAGEFERELRGADVGMVTSYCPDALAACEAVLASTAALKTFYDLDTPVTLEQLAHDGASPYVPRRGLREFDLVLSFTGGRALLELERVLGAQRTAPLYGSVDPARHFPTPAAPEYRSALSYLATYASDRAALMEQLFFEPARRLPRERFVLGGSMYPQSTAFSANVAHVEHVPPPRHSSFYCSSRFTLNITRQAMKDYGYCPSGRVFEAAACGVPMLSDAWEGLEDFFEPGREIIVANHADDVVRAFSLSATERARLSASARARVLSEHTARRRAQQLLAYVTGGVPGRAFGETRLPVAASLQNQER
jgi:spore maturation protein CgeB